MSQQVSVTSEQLEQLVQDYNEAEIDLSDYGFAVQLRILDAHQKLLLAKQALEELQALGVF